VPSDKNADESLKKYLKNFGSYKNFRPSSSGGIDRAKANLLKQIDQILRIPSYLEPLMSEFIGAGRLRLAFIQRDKN